MKASSGFISPVMEMKTFFRLENSIKKRFFFNKRQRTNHIPCETQISQPNQNQFTEKKKLFTISLNNKIFTESSFNPTNIRHLNFKQHANLDIFQEYKHLNFVCFLFDFFIYLIFCAWFGFQMFNFLNWV